MSDVQYGIQAFAKFKRPECTRLHLRELSENFPGGACAYPGCQRLLSHARKTSGTQGSMRPKLPTKVHRSQSWWALSRPYCHCILYLWAPSITKSSVRPCEVFLFRIKSDCYLIARSLSRILYFRQVLTLVDSFDCLGPLSYFLLFNETQPPGPGNGPLPGKIFPSLRWGAGLIPDPDTKNLVHVIQRYFNSIRTCENWREESICDFHVPHNAILFSPQNFV